MNNVSTGLLVIVMGIIAIVFRKPLAEHSVGFQVQVFRLPFGQKAVDAVYLLTPVMGVLFIVIGLLTIFGVIK